MNIVERRKLWQVIESTHARTILGWSDAQLIQQILLRFPFSDRPTGTEISAVSAYIHDRIALIRYLAQVRMSPNVATVEENLKRSLDSRYN